MRRALLGLGALVLVGCEPPRPPPRDIVHIEQCKASLLASDDGASLRVLRVHELRGQTTSSGVEQGAGAFIIVEPEPTCDSGDPAVASLVARGASISLRPHGEHLAIELRSSDREVAREIVRIARARAYQTAIDDVRESTALLHGR